MVRKRPAVLVPGDWVRMPHANRIKLVERALEVSIGVARTGNRITADAVLVTTSGGAMWLCSGTVELETYTTEEARDLVLGERMLRAAAGAHGRTPESLGHPPDDDLAEGGVA